MSSKDESFKQSWRNQMRKEKTKDKGCCKLNKMILSLSSLIILIALALTISAAPALTLNTVTWQEGTRVNVSTKSANDASQVNMSFVTLRFSASNTANSTSLTLINITNTTETNFDFGYANFTFGNDMILEDTAVGAVTGVSTGILSGGDVALASTTITVDRTIPQLPTSATPTGTLTSRDQTISATVNGANTTTCTLTFVGKNPGYSGYVMTHTGNTCSQAFTNLPKGQLTYTVTAGDGTNSSSATTENTFTISLPTTTAKKAYIISGGQLPTQASATAQQRAKGQQGANALDRVIAKAPPEAQKGLMNAKEAVTKQYKGKEALKTWSGTAIGCTAGFFVVPVIGLIPGCITGHLVGAVV